MLQEGRKKRGECVSNILEGIKTVTKIGWGGKTCYRLEKWGGGMKCYRQGGFTQREKNGAGNLSNFKGLEDLNNRKIAERGKKWQEYLKGGK